MIFNVGDRVELIDDVVRGEIISVGTHSLRILTTDGFMITEPKHRVVRRDALPIDPKDIARSKGEKDPPIATNQPKPLQDYLEVDLHIEASYDRFGRKSNYQALPLQMQRAKDKLEYALHKRIGKIVFIHGVGEGILKNTLRDYLSSLPYVDFYDADYKRYGEGGTEVKIYLSKAF